MRPIIQKVTLFFPAHKKITAPVLFIGRKDFAVTDLLFLADNIAGKAVSLGPITVCDQFMQCVYVPSQ